MEGAEEGLLTLTLSHSFTSHDLSGTISLSLSLNHSGTSSQLFIEMDLEDFHFLLITRRS